MRLHLVANITSVIKEFGCFEAEIEHLNSSVRQDAPSMTCVVASWCSTHTKTK